MSAAKKIAREGASIETWQARGVGLEGQTVSIVAFGGLLMFALFFTLAIAKTRQRIVHPRLMFLASLSIMQGVWGRIGLLIGTAGNPEFQRPGLLPPLEQPIAASFLHFAFSAVVLGVVAWHDKRCHGSLQQVTWVGGGALLVMLFGRHLLAGTATWQAIADILVAM